jgi:Uri superfamily endonuclease
VNLSKESYQLFIQLSQSVRINIGKLGLFNFPKGKYVYTGSAKKNMDARIARHFSKEKKLYWHIDYLLLNHQVKITHVVKSNLSECDLNARVKGEVVVKGFGSSDCKNKCKSHLKYLLNSV